MPNRLHARRKIGELSAALETVQGEHLPNVPASGRTAKAEALAAAGLSKTEAQRAMVAARLATLGDGVRADRQGASIEAPTQAEAAQLLNVGRVSVPA